MPSPEKREAAALAEAARLGQEAGHAAGTWAADGNTSEFHARAVLAMLEEGDPAGWDLLPEVPSLSGEWAGAPTPLSLAGECWPWEPEPSPEFVSELCEAWEEAASLAHGEECERVLRAVLPEPEHCGGGGVLISGEVGEGYYSCPGCPDCTGEEPGA